MTVYIAKLNMRQVAWVPNFIEGGRDPLFEDEVILVKAFKTREEAQACCAAMHSYSVSDEDMEELDDGDIVDQWAEVVAVPMD